MSQSYLSERVATLKPSGIRKFFDIVATMKDVISLGIGEPDFTTPEPILQAGIRSLEHGENALHFEFWHPGAAPGAGDAARTGCMGWSTIR